MHWIENCENAIISFHREFEASTALEMDFPCSQFFIWFTVVTKAFCERGKSFSLHSKWRNLLWKSKSMKDNKFYGFMFEAVKLVSPSSSLSLPPASQLSTENNKDFSHFSPTPCCRKKNRIIIISKSLIAIDPPPIKLLHFQCSTFAIGKKRQPKFQ